MEKIVQCVPNFSEGRDEEIINKIVASLGKKVLLCGDAVEPGEGTNRTVITFYGSPENVVEAAFQAAKTAIKLIDMRKHKGAHSRFGALDVLPLIPVKNITMKEVVDLARNLAKRIGDELKYPVYCYEDSCFSEQRRNLADIRKGEYEGLAKKLTQPEWKPDFGPAKFVPRSGATAVGARDFLIAVNFNLNTTSTRRGSSVAFDIRQIGRVMRVGNKLTGEILRDEKTGEPLRHPGKCVGTKARCWFIPEYGVCQVTMNITNINKTPLHVAFEECRKAATNRGLRVTGTEIVGQCPLKAMVDAGKHFLKQQNRSTGIPTRDIVFIAIKSMGLDEIKKFKPDDKVIEFLLEKQLQIDGPRPLINMKLREFTYEVGSGGSCAATVSSFAVALAQMVANNSAHKRGWDDRVGEFSDLAEECQVIVDKLIKLVDDDSKAFEEMMAARRVPKSDNKRAEKIKLGIMGAVNVPLAVMETTRSSFELIEKIVEVGNPNCVSDVGSAVYLAVAGIKCANLNVQINLTARELKEDPKFMEETREKASRILRDATAFEKRVSEQVHKKLSEF